MPKQQLNLTQQAEAALEAVREQQGLETLEQAAEWLLRRRIRRGSQGLTGRGRALYDTQRGNGGMQ